MTEELLTFLNFWTTGSAPVILGFDSTLVTLVKKEQLTMSSWSRIGVRTKGSTVHVGARTGDESSTGSPGCGIRKGWLHPSYFTEAVRLKSPGYFNILDKHTCTHTHKDTTWSRGRHIPHCWRFPQMNPRTWQPSTRSYRSAVACGH